MRVGIAQGFIYIRPHRITASPSDSQSEGRGSIPRGAAKKTRKRFFFEYSLKYLQITDNPSIETRKSLSILQDREKTIS